MYMIKTVIFDFDSTLYVGDVWENWIEHLKKLYKYIVNDDEKLKKILEKYDLKKYNSTLDAEIIAEKENLSLRRLKKFLKEKLYVHSTNDVKVIDSNFIKELKKHCHLYVISISGQEYLKHYFDLYHLDKKDFKKIYSLDLYAKDKTKGLLMKKIMKKEKCSPEETVMIGDNLETDIKPAQKLNLNYLHFTGDFNQIYKYFTDKKVLDGTKYIK